MKKWKYKIIHFMNIADVYDSEQDVLNWLGDQGWELVSVVNRPCISSIDYNKIEHRTEYVFKKEI